MVPDLRIEEHGRIGEPGHDRVAPVDVAVVLALSPLPVTGRGLLTATGRGVEALGHGETALAVTALGMTGRGLLTATGCSVSERVPLPAGEIGVTARGHTLS